MRQINLLPTDLRPTKKLSLAIKKAEKVFIGLLVIYIITLTSAYFADSLLTKKFQEFSDKKNELSNELKSLAKVETSTVYIRDRIEKYYKLTDKDIELTTLNLFEDSHQNFPPDAIITLVDISEKNINYSVSVTDVVSLTSILDGLSDSKLYKDINISSLGYQEGKGYSFFLTLTF